MRRRQRNRVINQYAWARWTTRIAIAAAAATLVLALAWPEAPTQSRPTTARQLPAGYDLLTQAFDRVRSTLLDSARAREYESLQAHADALTVPLLWVLARPWHAHFRQAAELAAELGVDAAIAPLEAALNGSEPVARPPALLALDRLQPFADSDIADFVPEAATDASLALAVLQLVKRRSEPTPELVRAALTLLAHRDRGVRERALAHLPAELPAEALPTLLDLVDDALAGATAIQLLGRVPPTPASIQVLVDRLAGLDPDLQPTVLATIDRYTSAEPVRRLLWEFATGDAAVPLRSAAIYALERGRVEHELPEASQDWPGPVRYHAARLRIATGHLDGIQLLVQLLANESDGQRDAAAQATIGQTRVLLSRLAQLPPHAEASAFAEWAAALTELPPLDLPPPRPAR